MTSVCGGVFDVAFKEFKQAAPVEYFPFQRINLLLGVWEETAMEQTLLHFAKDEIQETIKKMYLYNAVNSLQMLAFVIARSSYISHDRFSPQVSHHIRPRGNFRRVMTDSSSEFWPQDEREFISSPKGVHPSSHGPQVVSQVVSLEGTAPVSK